MPALTRRRDPEAQQETWLIYFAGVHIGTIARSVGNPRAAPARAMALRLLSGQRSRRVQGWHRADL